MPAQTVVAATSTAEAGVTATGSGAIGVVQVLFHDSSSSAQVVEQLQKCIAAIQKHYAQL